MSEVMCSGCNKTFDRAKARVFVKHRQNCHEDHGKHFDGLPVYTLSEARSKSRYKIYGECAFEAYHQGIGVTYAETYSQEDIKYLWDTKNPLIGFRRWGLGWTSFCRIKPDET